MNGTLVNGIAIVIGSIIGIVLKSGFIKAKSKAIMGALGLSTLIIGFQGVISYPNVLLLIVSLASGVLIGEFLKLEDHINRFAYSLEKRFAKGSDNTFAQGFVSASILFGVGAMAIVGSLESGLRQNETILYTKSLLDFISSIVFASTYGWGVLFSAFVIVLYQGSITILSTFVAPVMTDVMVADISAVGSALIIAIGLNMLEMTKLKLANFLPAIVVMIVLSYGMTLI